MRCPKGVACSWVTGSGPFESPSRVSARQNCSPQNTQRVCWYSENLGARRPGVDSNFFVNRGTHHCQDLVRNVRHVMRDRDVIGGLGQNLLFGIAVRLKCTPGNKIITVKDFRHVQYPPLVRARIAAGHPEWMLATLEEACQWYFANFPPFRSPQPADAEKAKIERVA